MDPMDHLLYSPRHPQLKCGHLLEDAKSSGPSFAWPEERSRPLGQSKVQRTAGCTSRLVYVDFSHAINGEIRMRSKVPKKTQWFWKFTALNTALSCWEQLPPMKPPESEVEVVIWTITVPIWNGNITHYETTYFHCFINMCPTTGSKNSCESSAEYQLLVPNSRIRRSRIQQAMTDPCIVCHKNGNIYHQQNPRFCWHIYHEMP